MLTIDFRGPSENPGLRTYLEQRLQSWIGPVGDDLPGVTVCLASRDEGGVPRFRCRMLARPLHWASVAVEQTEGDWYTAIDRCTERLVKHLALARKAHLATRWRGLGRGGASAGRRGPSGGRPVTGGFASRTSDGTVGG